MMSFLTLTSINDRGAIQIGPTAWQRHIYAWKKFLGSGQDYACDIQIEAPPNNLELNFCDPGNFQNNDCNRRSAVYAPGESIYVRFDPVIQCNQGDVSQAGAQYVPMSAFKEKIYVDAGEFKFSYWIVQVNPDQSIHIVIIIENDNIGGEAILGLVEDEKPKDDPGTDAPYV